MPSGAIVVVGASGFLGSAVCSVLADAGASVVAASRGSGTKHPDPRLASCGIERLGEHAGAVCLHLGGSSDPADIAMRFDEHLKEAEEAAEKIIRAGFSRVVLASSAAVYDDSSPEPRAEESPVNPATAYGRLKRRMEEMFSSSGGAIARISNVYGPRMQANNVIPEIARQLESGDRVRLRNLTGIRDYLFVSDAARALAELTRADLKGVYNVSTGRGTSVDELITAVGRALGRERVAREAVADSGRLSALVLNPAKIRRDLGWQPQVSLADGLRYLAKKPV